MLYQLEPSPPTVLDGVRTVTGTPPRMVVVPAIVQPPMAWSANLAPNEPGEFRRRRPLPNGRSTE